MTAMQELLQYISAMTPEQVEKVISNLPQLISVLEAQGQPVPPIEIEQTP